MQLDITDEDALWAALDANDGEPYGPVRAARAEALADAAERAGNVRLRAWALLRLVLAYEYSGEKPRIPVPMARLVRLWDERADEFDEALTHSLLWHLKWVPSALLASPEVPLAAIRGFGADMERRFRLAGRSPRPVHQSRFYVARHVGDLEEAARAHAAWLTAERDDLADCHACERHEQGRWLVSRGDDAGALEVFAPTLGGELRCAEEPHRTYATSLLSLVRLGRLDEARANHLRGYRLARGLVSLAGSIADHMRFCALTGNVGRGLEILSEHRSWLGPAANGAPELGGALADLSDRQDFLSGVAVLMREVCARGLGDLAVPPAPGCDGTAAGLLAAAERDALAIAARYDARNGTPWRTRRLRERLDTPPLLDELPLGVRSVIPRQAGSARPAASPAAPLTAVPAPGADPVRPGGPGPGDLDALADLGVRQEREGHPDALDTLRRCAEAAAARGGEPADGIAARLARVRAHRGPDDEAPALLDQAVALFERAGEPGQALATRAAGESARTRAAMLASDDDTPGRARVEAVAAVAAEADARLADLEAAAAALPPGDDPGAALTQVAHARVLVAFARYAVAAVAAGEGGDAPEDPADGREHDRDHDRDEAPELSALAEYAPLVAAARHLDETAERHGQVARRSTAAHVRGRLALDAGDPETAVRELAAAASFAHEAGRPWLAAPQEALRGQVLLSIGRPAEAEEALRAALAEVTVRPSEDIGEGRLWLALGDALARLDRPAESLEALLRAAARAEREDDEAGAAIARSAIGATLYAMERWSDAAAVLEDALPTAEEHLGPVGAMEDRHRLGMCLRHAGEHREAARHLVIAAEAAARHADLGTRAWFAVDAAHALNAAGMWDEARLAFDRAIALLRDAAAPGALVRTLRAAAWNLVDADEAAEEAADEAAEEDRETGEAGGVSRPTRLDVTTDRAVALFGEAFRVVAAAGEEAPDMDPAYELGLTHGQLARVLWRAERCHGAAEHADRGAEVLAALLPGSASAYADVAQVAARLRAWPLGDPAGAVARLEAAVRACAGAGVPEAAAGCAELLEHLREPSRDRGA